MEAFIQATLEIDSFYVLALIAGTVCGYIIGALPGFSATMGVALFVPFSYQLESSVAFAFLVALYCSAVFAGSIPAILIRTPGTPCGDMHDLRRLPHGQAGRGRPCPGAGMLFLGVRGNFQRYRADFRCGFGGEICPVVWRTGVFCLGDAGVEYGDRHVQ